MSLPPPNHQLLIYRLRLPLHAVVIETKNRTLEETAALFDGEDVAEKISGQAAMGVAGDNRDEKGSSGSFHENKV